MRLRILMNQLMIPVYQANPHDNTVRKDVRGLAIMGMLLGLLDKFGLDLLGPGNLAEHISSVSKRWVRKGQRAILLASGEGILGNHRPGPCTGLERPSARSTVGRAMNDTVQKSRAVNLLWRTLASTRSTANDLRCRLQPCMRFRGDSATYRHCS